MYCPKCGADHQTPDSYCRQCGEWLPDLNALAKRRLFGKLTREQKIEKIRTLEIISAGLSITALAIIISVLAGGDRQMLFLAAVCCLCVTTYQIVNMYLGYKLQKMKRSRANETEVIEGSGVIADSQPALNAPVDQFISPAGVTENTTDLLEPVPVERGGKTIPID